MACAKLLVSHSITVVHCHSSGVLHRWPRCVEESACITISTRKGCCRLTARSQSPKVMKLTRRLCAYKRVVYLHFAVGRAHVDLLARASAPLARRLLALYMNLGLDHVTHHRESLIDLRPTAAIDLENSLLNFDIVWLQDGLGC